MSGLPIDIRERELRNIFRFSSGFKGCVLRVPEVIRSNSPVFPSAFVLFETQEDAAYAKNHLHGTAFDLEEPPPETGHRQPVLSIAFARNELDLSKLEKSTKRKHEDFSTSREGNYDGELKRSKYQGGGELSMSSRMLLNSEGLNSFYPTNGLEPQVDSYGSASQYGYLPMGFVESPAVYDDYSRSSQMMGGLNDFSRSTDVMDRVDFSRSRPRDENFRAPSGGRSSHLDNSGGSKTTLYVSNLPADVDQEELESVFRLLKGFKDMKIVRSAKQGGPRRAFAFVEFYHQQPAAQALKDTDGKILKSTDGGIRVAWSRTPLKEAQR